MKISVILPVKNPDMELLERALKSVGSQTYTDYEVLLVNDGSDPEYKDKIGSLAGRFQNVKLYEIPASGVSAARNFAANKAEGDILTYLDSDDMLSPYCFEEAVSILEKTDLDAVWGGTFYGNSDQIAERLQNIEHKDSELINLDEERMHITKAECIGEPYRYDDGCYINRGIAGRFIRKEAVFRAGLSFPEGLKFYEDAIWNLRALQNMKIAYAHTEWYYYLDNEASVSNKFNPDIADDLERPLAVIRGMLDMDDEVEYKGYTRLLMDSLRYVNRNLYANPSWNASGADKKKLRDHLYNDEPWSEIGTDKYKEYAEERDRRKAALYRAKKLLFYWKLAWK